MDDESDIALTDEEDPEARDSRPRKLSLSPTQYLQSRAKKPLSRSQAMLQEAMENPPVFASPFQVLEAKGKGASADVLVEAVACVSASGANSIQRDNQGHPQGSSSVSLSSPSYNLPPAELAQELRRSLAAGLIQSGSGRSLSTPPAKHSQEPGTAIPISAPTLTRRNNPNSSLQVQDDNRTEEEFRVQAQHNNRTVDEFRDKLLQFGEARRNTRSELSQLEAQSPHTVQPRIEFARGQLSVANEGQGQAATLSRSKFSQPSIDSQDRINAEHLRRMEESRIEKRRQREAEAERQREAESTGKAARKASTASPTTAASTQVMDMRFCISNLDAIRAEAGWRLLP